MPSFITEYPQFFTATNLEWKPLLKQDKYKDIIISSMDFLAKDKRVIIYGFVIMHNHLHIIWQMQPGIKRDAVQRKFQFWERNSLSVDLWSREVFIQKLNYIHENPVRASLCMQPEDYKYSSALFYETAKDDWGFLTHYNE
jgi:REP element-mobilizing transposase RayT